MRLQKYKLHSIRNMPGCFFPNRAFGYARDQTGFNKKAGSILNTTGFFNNDYVNSFS